MVFDGHGKGLVSRQLTQACRVDTKVRSTAFASSVFRHCQAATTSVVRDSHETLMNVLNVSIRGTLKSRLTVAEVKVSATLIPETVGMCSQRIQRALQ